MASAFSLGDGGVKRDDAFLSSVEQEAERQRVRKEREAAEAAAKAEAADNAYKIASSPANQKPGTPDVSGAMSPAELLRAYAPKQAVAAPGEDPVAAAVRATPGAATPQDLNQSTFIRSWGDAAKLQPVTLPPKPAPSVSVGMSAPVPAEMRNRPFEPLTPPASADAATVPAPAATATAAPPPTPPASAEDELAAAQEQSRKRHLWAMLPAMFGAKAEDLEKIASAPVAELLARKKYGDERIAKQRETEEYEKKKTLDAPDSPASKRAQLLMQLRGVDPKIAAQLPASALPDILSATHANDEAKNQLAMREQSRAEMLSREGIETRKEANERTLHAMDNAARIKEHELTARKDAAPKPYPEQNAAKLINQLDTPKLIDEAEKAFNDIGPVGGSLDKVTPASFDTASNRYYDAVNARLSGIAAGSAPAARENAQLMEEFKKSFPKANWDRHRAKQFFDGLRETARKNAEGNITAGEAAGYSPPQMAEFRKRLGGSRVRVVGPNGERGTMDAAELAQHPGWKQVP